MNTLTKEQTRQQDLATARGHATFRTLIEHCRSCSRYQAAGDDALAGVHLECAERALLDLEVDFIYAPVALRGALETARWAISALGDA